MKMNKPVRSAGLCALVWLSCSFSPAGAAGPAAVGSSRGVEGQTTMFSESEAYERFMGRWSRQLAPLFVKFAGVGSSDSVLDVGSGTGALAAAVIRLNAGARVVGVDPSSEYVAFANKTVASDRASFIVGDAQQLQFPDAKFDRTLALLVMNFIPDRERAIREMIRVTRPGGIVAAAVWDYGDGMQMLRAYWDEAVALKPSAESRDERHMPLCRPGELAAFWSAHGLTDVEEQPLTITLAFASFDDFWAPFLGGQGPAGAYVASLTDAERAELASRLRRRLTGTGSTGRITLTARAWAVKGRHAPARDAQ